jgi:molybdopterin-binding protein
MSLNRLDAASIGDVSALLAMTRTLTPNPKGLFVPAGKAVSDRLDRAAAGANGDRAPVPQAALCRPEEGKMKLSARNQLKGKIVAVTKGQTTAHVRLDIGGGVIVTSSITNEAVDDLSLKAGDEAFAVIKASDVMVAK